MIEVIIKTSHTISRVKQSTAPEDLADLLQVIQQAIKGAGYFPTGNLDFIEEE